MGGARRTVVISGGAAGIGRAMAFAFARNGDHAVILDIDEEGQGLAECLVRGGLSAEFHRVDMARWDAIEDTVARVARNHGAISVAVANAGIARRVALQDLDETAWDDVLQVNLKGAAQLLRTATAHMRTSDNGALIAVSSISAQLGWPEHVHYNASKAGLEGLVKGLAAELGPRGIRVNAILPGVIRTAQSLSVEHSLGESGLRDMAARIPLGRVGYPDDVADVALFLASDAARYISGQSIVVDGGLTVASY